ncbi:hypothetical protein BUE76_20965 [Cnuella takakiae]|nr:hypothetical protein BUE76_20965 [Cnuella takakiae]
MLEPGEVAGGREGWPEQLVTLFTRNDAPAKLVLFTYDSHHAASAHERLQVVVLQRPRFFWSRYRQHRALRAQVAELKADRVLFYGISSYVAGMAKPALILTADDFRKKRVLQLRKKAFAGLPVFVANKQARENVLGLTGNKQPVTVVYGCLPGRSVVELDTQLVKDRFTAGAEYFLYQGALSQKAELINLLKAFSRFKRRQKSGWKLVLVPGKPEPLKDLEDLLATYKYREDVVLVAAPAPEVVESLFAAAWCFVYPSLPGYTPNPLLQALAWQLPLIATNACKEWVGAAGLYFEPGDEVALADHLMYIYKDEGLHQRLREAALAEQVKFSWQPLLY